MDAKGEADMNHRHDTTILLVEDDVSIAKAISQKIKGFGYDMMIAHSGEDAVKRATDHHNINLILMDTDPGGGIDGTEAARQILAVRHLPIVFLASRAEEECESSVKAIARYGYVLKNSGDFVLQSSIEMALELFREQEKNRLKNEELQTANEKLRKANHDLEERVKELNCIYEFGQIVESHDRIDDIIGGVLDVLQQAWQYPDITAVRIAHAGHIFHTDNFSYTQWQQSADIITEGEQTGKIEIVYLEQRPEECEGPFLKEERILLDTIAERLGRNIERIRKMQEYSNLFHTLNEAILKTDASGLITEANRAAAELIGYDSPDELIGLPVTTFYANPETRPTQVRRLQEDGGEFHNFEFLLKRKNGSTVWTLCNIKLLKNKEGEFIGTLGAIRDISERRKATEELQRLEWLLTKSVTPIDSDERPYQSPYGDVTDSNTCRVILDSVEKETLKRIAEDSIDLLDTCVAIYEKNGDYALGIFSSGWCRLCDLASRGLCGDVENQEALTCGKWLCHESCWHDSSKPAIESGQPTDIVCVGGIRLYAVPIVAGDEIVGAINIGYGDPPTDEQSLLELAERFDVDVEDIRNVARTYRSRPLYIIELVKKRLHTTAKLIGEIVERRKAEEALRNSLIDLKLAQKIANIGNWQFDPEIGMPVWSDQVYTIYNRDPAQGPPHIDEYTRIYEPDQFEIFNTAIQRAIKEGKPYDIILKLKLPGGIVKWINAICQPDEKKGNAGYFLRGTIQDITEQKHTEHALKQSEKRYRKAQKLGHVGNWEYNIQTTEFWGSDEAKRIYGFGPKFTHFTTEDVESCIPDRENVHQALVDLIEKDTEYNLEFDILTHDTGERKTIVSLAQLERDEHGKPLKVTGVIQDLTDRKKAEQALKESEERLSILVNTSPFPIAVADTADEKILYWSQSAKNMFGHTPKVVSEWYALAYPDPQYRQEVINRWKPCLEIAQHSKIAVNTGEYRIVCRDGSVKICELYAKFIPGNLIVTFNDITERKQAEDALRQSEEKFRLQFKSSPMPTFIYRFDNQHFRLLDNNEAADRLSIGTVKNFINMTAEEIYPDRPDLIKNFYTCLDQKDVIVCETDYRSRGTRLSRLIVFTYSYISSDLIMMHAEDITDRKRAEIDLRISLEKYRVLFESFPVGVSVTDSKGNLLEVNRESERLLGVSPQEHTKRTIDGQEWKIIRPDGTPMPAHEYASVRALKTHQAVENMEMGIVKEKKETTWINVHAAPIPIEGYGIIITYHDITDRKQAEEKLKEYSLRLEEMVEERTRELKKAQEELIKKERLAVLGHFAGSISHELRNPLAVIDSAAYYLEMKLANSDDKIRRHLKTICENVKKSTDIIQSLLNLSRMEKPKTKKTDVTDLVSETIRSSKIPETIELILNLPDVSLFLDVENEQIRMALKNIINNAVQAMDEKGKLTISIRSFQTGYIEIHIADTGSGILPENTEKIFEPLFSTKTHGIGFGLSITKMIVENHGGKIHVESDLGTGATFIITLPLVLNYGEKRDENSIGG